MQVVPAVNQIALHVGMGDDPVGRLRWSGVTVTLVGVAVKLVGGDGYADSDIDNTSQAGLVSYTTSKNILVQVRRCACWLMCAGRCAWHVSNYTHSNTYRLILLLAMESSQG